MNRIRVFALALLALCGLTAFVAAGASANWLEGGVEVKANKEVLAKAHTIGELAVPGLNIEFRCTTIAGQNLKILASSEKAEGKVAFSGCTAWSPANLKGTEQSKCTPQSQPIVAGGSALLILHNAKNYVLFSPESGKPFTTINLPESCALAATSNVTGNLVTECGTLNGSKVFVGEDCATARVEHLLQPAPAALFETDKLKFGANAATLAGIAAVELASKVSWAGHV